MPIRAPIDDLTPGPSEIVVGNRYGDPLRLRLSPGDVVVGGANGEPEKRSWSEKASVTDVPTIGELAAQTTIPGTITAGAGISYPVFIAPFPCVVAYAALMSWGNAIAADDVNYWTVQLRRLRAGTSAVIATKTTKVTGGQAIAQRTEWNYDAVVFDATNKVLQKGDGIDFSLTYGGAPTNFNTLILTIRYEPV